LRSLLARGKTILLTTHFMEEAERLCDRLCVIEEGRKIAEGAPHALIESEIGCDVIEIYGPDPVRCATTWRRSPSAPRSAAKRCSAT
jgi:lipooligosaccharide transport system ATP-binding protein